MKPKKVFILILVLLSVQVVFAGNDSLSSKKQRVILHGVSGLTYVGTFAILNQVWYSQYERSSFQFFDDSKEWLQVDKVGHAQAAYLITNNLLYPTYRSFKYSKKQSIYMAMGVSWVYQATIEVLDGFSAKWGASWSDLAANTFGVALAGGQQLYWDEQRILFKYSTSFAQYPSDPVVQERADRLYGTFAPERLFKDYNGTTFWLSTNIKSFCSEESKVPAWLNIAVGYGANGMLGGFGNRWEDADGVSHNYDNIDRYRQYYLSPDIDLTKLPIKGKAWKVIAPILNTFKIPMPALELGNGKVRGHWVYF